MNDLNGADLQQLIDQLAFEDVVKRETEKYLHGGTYSFNSYLNTSDDDKKFILNGIKIFANKQDKMLFLLVTISFLNGEFQEAVENLNKPEMTQEEKRFERLAYGGRDWQRQKYRAETQLFFAVRELEKLGVKKLDKQAFTPIEVDDLTRKIDVLLILVDKLTVGQEVLYNFIDELKSDLAELKTDFPLGKKRWYQRFAGIAASYLTNKGADELFEILKPEIAKIIHDQGQNLLSKL